MGVTRCSRGAAFTLPAFSSPPVAYEDVVEDARDAQVWQRTLWGA